jgi:glycosyltransferase involved in cell wall biosynthesis
LSPSVLYSAKENGLPVVWTVHDYEPLCPNTLFLNRNGVCEDCKGDKYYKVISNRCKKESLSASIMAAIIFYAHRTASIYKMIDYFITPSEFLKNKLIDYGFDSKKIVHIPNFIDIEKIRANYTHSDYFLYLGRLSREKGILTLLKAIKSLQGSARLKIVGKGQIEEEIVNYITINKLENLVEMLGYRGEKELEDIMKKAMFVVVPSECYENFPYAVLEAFAYGKPVIGANIGGIPEQIDDGVNGYLFEYKNTSELAEKIISLIDNPDKIVEMGKKAREKAELKYNSQHHYETLMNLYRRLV